MPRVVLPDDADVLRTGANGREVQSRLGNKAMAGKRRAPVLARGPRSRWLFWVSAWRGRAANTTVCWSGNIRRFRTSCVTRQRSRQSILHATWADGRRLMLAGAIVRRPSLAAAHRPGPARPAPNSERSAWFGHRWGSPRDVTSITRFILLPPMESARQVQVGGHHWVVNVSPVRLRSERSDPELVLMLPVRHSGVRVSSPGNPAMALISPTTQSGVVPLRTNANQSVCRAVVEAPQEAGEKPD